MQSIIRAWGNSQGLYIPKKLLREASLSVNDLVEISVVDGILMIRKNAPEDKKRAALEALLEIRNAHRGNSDIIGEDYRAERDKHIDEKYGR